MMMMMMMMYDVDVALNIDKCAVCRFGRNIAMKSDYNISDKKFIQLKILVLRLINS